MILAAEHLPDPDEFGDDFCHRCEVMPYTDEDGLCDDCRHESDFLRVADVADRVTAYWRTVTRHDLWRWASQLLADADSRLNEMEEARG